MTSEPLFAFDELEPGSVRRVVVADHAIAIIRIDDDVYAVGDRCSHADVSLSGGEVWTDEREIECPKHGSTFDLVTGEPQTLPATQPIPVYDVAVVEGQVVVTITETEDVAR